ncbi:MAG: hemolysin [Oligoflexia bacterium]|nr:MAG: hemolysin [Oligoflexia bacterium]
MSMTESNPVGLNGVDYVEFSGPDGKYLENLFLAYGFKEVGKIQNKNIKLFRQGRINFILNCEPNTFATDFAQKHGPCINATGFRVHDAEFAFKTAVARGAKPYDGNSAQRGATPFPAVYGIGDSLIYFVDEKLSKKLYSQIFSVSAQDQNPAGAGLHEVDHFTNNVPVGEMQKWCDFYINVFNFRETRYFNIQGKLTGLYSKVMRSPCGKFSVPINEPSDKKSQIQEYLDEYKGSGIQHLALQSDNIIATLEKLKSQKLEFLTPPPGTYYKMLNDRVPNVKEDVERLQSNAVLVDGDDQGYLLQIFSKNIIGPIFFELIQRQNHSGFGEGNFQALFDSIERDQQERGYLK